jgi:hypothetical protein
VLVAVALAHLPLAVGAAAVVGNLLLALTSTVVARPFQHRWLNRLRTAGFLAGAWAGVSVIVQWGCDAYGPSDAEAGCRFWPQVSQGR